MSRASLLRIVIASIVVLTSAVAGHAARSDKPNVILILADDLGAADVGCYGSTEYRTPNLDRMAEQGLRLDTFYATPLCTPTRVCLMTGQYGFRTGYRGMQNEAFLPPADSPQRHIGNHFTIGDLMKSAGYRTAMAGKWQLPGEHPTLIRDCGFDEYRMWAYTHNLPEGVTHTGRFEDRRQTKPARFWHPSLVENGKYIPTKPGDYGPDLLVDFILGFARKHKDEPFFVYHTSLLTHSPFEPTPDPNAPGRKWPEGFKSNLEYLDHLMGRMRNGLEEMGLDRNTVIIFVGDNGTGGRGKGQVSELGVRVPFIVWNPHLVKPLPQARRALADLTDIMPTLAELAGARLPQDKEFDGKSMVPLLRGETASHREWIYGYLDDGHVLRSDRWLLEIPRRGGAQQFFDCGEARDGTGYKDVSDSTDVEVAAARRRFARIIEGIPAVESSTRVQREQPRAEQGQARTRQAEGRRARRERN